MKTLILSCSLLLFSLSLMACGGHQSRSALKVNMFAHTGSPYIDPDTMTRDEIIYLPTGTKLDSSELYELLAQKRIVFVGEGHDNIYDHQVELAVIKNLFQLSSGQLAVGFEMLSHLNQKKIDLWQADELSDEDFIRLFAEEWGVANFVYYREIFDYLKAHKIPIRALNVNRQEKMKYMRGLMAADKEKNIKTGNSVAEIADPYQEEALQAMFKGHTQGHGNVGVFIEVHKLWEDTMAHNIKSYLESPAGSDRKLIVIAGGFHIAHGYGLPRRVFQQAKLDYCTLLTHTPEVLVENERQTMDVDFPELPLYLCDYLMCVPYRNLKDKQARLGIGMQSADRGIKIVMVEKGSVAERNDLQIGDLLIVCDGKTLKEPIDLSILLLQKVKGQTIKLQIEREGVIKGVEILL